MHIVLSDDDVTKTRSRSVIVGFFKATLNLFRNHLLLSVFIFPNLFRPDPTKGKDDSYTAYYKVHGAILGFTTLSFTAASKTGHMISSKLRDIQVCNSAPMCHDGLRPQKS